jgi:hypothetical protein
MTDYHGSIVCKSANRGQTSNLVINSLSTTIDSIDILQDDNFYDVLQSYVQISSVASSTVRIASFDTRDTSLSGHIRTQGMPHINHETLAARWMISPERAKRRL